MTSLNKKERIDFSNLNDKHLLSNEDLIKNLDLAVEMLFYLQEDTFDKKDIQNAVFVIKRIVDSLRK
ncbi:hypothetical protein [Flavivirga algicola]|uniref:Uncharacterized protein n=1 Tax=Flavivirga algicola TaxID=2729136 RepID=A0ABX1RZV8_9FLAO|nr:hypothetical protein [Flavivirga algicola]NMH87724.1 hypothetical protein [Flavivirga algicola]